MSPRARLRVYRLDPRAAYTGELLGAIERAEASAGTRLLDALLVRRTPGGGLEAVDLATGTAGHTFAALLDFRLDPVRREAATQRTLAGPLGAAVGDIAAALGPGHALLAALSGADDADALGDAVAAGGGTLAADEPVAADSLAEVPERLVAAATDPGSGAP